MAGCKEGGLFATPTGRITTVEIDGRVGGKFRIARDEGQDIEHAGEYFEIERPQRLVFTFGVPKFSSELSRVILEPSAEGEGCELTLTQEDTLADYAERNVQGRTMILDNLDRMLRAAWRLCGRHGQNGAELRPGLRIHRLDAFRPAGEGGAHRQATDFDDPRDCGLDRTLWCGTSGDAPGFGLSSWMMPEPHTIRAAATGPRYRPEIDGLRALAILPVLLFHFRVPPFGGGFVGVDVFFVISGFLITQLIMAERDAGRFSLAGFYERRIRRIFPALVAMLAVVTAVSAVVLFPADFARYAKSLFATALFASNFEFWSEAGYFDVVAVEKPLLHLWSIAVEEQFYLLFPAILLVLRRASRTWLTAVVAAIFVLSMGLAAWGVMHAPTATFYLLPGRAWELMLGALLAIAPELSPRLRWLREAFVSGGVALIAFAVVSFSTATPFPGPAALIPCLGAALIIGGTTRSDTRAGAILASAPLVFIGQISYSLYLWHWPVYVLAHYLDFRDPTPGQIVLLLLLSFALAAFSWRFIEQPFRNKSFRPARAKLFAGGAAAMALCASVAVLVVADDGAPERLRPDLRQILAEENDHEPRIDTCFGLTPADVRSGHLCRIGLKGGAPSFLLWGDSHADAVLPVVARVAAQQGRTGFFAGGHSCPPLLDVTTPRPECRAFNAQVLALAAEPQIREVILEARWAKYAEGSPYGDEPQGHIVLADGGLTSDRDNHDVFARGLERTVKALAGKKIVIVASVPEIGWPVPAVLAREKLAAKTLVFPPSEEVYFDRQKFVMTTFAHLQHDDGVVVVYPHEILCAEGGVCAVSRNGIPLYRDEHHLSVYGALQLTPLFSAAL